MYPQMPAGAKFATGVTSTAAPYGYRAIEFDAEKNFEVGLVKNPDISDAQRAEAVRANRTNMTTKSVNQLENLLDKSIPGGMMETKVRAEVRERLRPRSDRYETDSKKRQQLRILRMRRT